MMVEKWIKEGIEHCKNAEFEKGVQSFDKALAINSNSVEGLYNRARALSRVGRLNDSLNDFKQLTLFQPNNPTFIGDYAVALHLNEKNEDALTQFNLALALEPDNPYRYASRAFYFDRIGQLESAIADYEKAIELDPEDAISMNNKGLVEEKLGYKDKARKSFDQSNKMMGYNPEKSTALKELENEADKAQPDHGNDAPQFENRWEVIKSVFTKAGFKDFLYFTKQKFTK